MIQKTAAEKEALKKAKAAYKKDFRDYQTYGFSRQPQKEKLTQQFKKDGILPDEEILPDNYPVHFDFLYIIDEGEGKVIRSDIQGTVLHLKRDLKKQGRVFENVYSCSVSKRIISHV